MLIRTSILKAKQEKKRKVIDFILFNDEFCEKSDKKN